MVFIVYSVSLDRWLVYTLDVDRLVVVEIWEVTPAEVAAEFMVE